MPAKAHPFKPEEWSEVVKSAAGALTDNKIYPACTLITGLPEEEDEDVMATMELMDDLKGFKSLIVPLFFVPLGRMKDKDWFEFEKMTESQKQLLIQCFRHDVRFAKELMKEYFIDKRYGWFFEKGFNLFTWLLERRAKKEGLY